MKATVITGGSAPERSRLARARAQVGDLVWDFDHIAPLLWNYPRDLAGVELPPHVLRVTMALFFAVTRAIGREPDAAFNAYLVVGANVRGAAVARELGATLIDLDVPADTRPQ